MTDDPIIDVQGLNHWFGTGEARKQALYRRRPDCGSAAA